MQIISGTVFDSQRATREVKETTYGEIPRSFLFTLLTSIKNLKFGLIKYRRKISVYRILWSVIITASQRFMTIQNTHHSPFALLTSVLPPLNLRSNLNNLMLGIIFTYF